MPLPKLIKDIEYIVKLSDEPNDIDGLTGEQLRAEFDKAAADIKAYINDELLPYLESTKGAGDIGFAPVDGLEDVATIQAALEKIYSALSSVSVGQIPDKSLTTQKLADGAVDARTLATNAVVTASILNSAVTAIKLAAKAVTEAKLDDGAVSTRTIAEKAISEEKYGDGSVSSRAIASGGVATSNIADGAVTPDKLSADAKSKGVAVTLASGSWSSLKQTVAVEGVTAENNVLIAAAPTSRTAWNDAEIYCSAQAEGTLTFTCSTAPTADVTANVIILV